MKSPIALVNRKQTASLRMAGMLAIAPLWLMLAAVNTSAHAQTSNTADASSTTTSSPADWTEFHRDNMQAGIRMRQCLALTMSGNWD
jgi:hypothetical protein